MPSHLHCHLSQQDDAQSSAVADDANADSAQTPQDSSTATTVAKDEPTPTALDQKAVRRKIYMAICDHDPDDPDEMEFEEGDVSVS